MTNIWKVLAYDAVKVLISNVPSSFQFRNGMMTESDSEKSSKLSCSNYTKKLDRFFFASHKFMLLERSIFLYLFIFMSNLVLISRRRCSMISLALFFEWNSVFTFSVFVCLHFCLLFCLLICLQFCLLFLTELFCFDLSENGDAESHSKKKTKRMRTTFTEEQIQILQANFQIDSNPDGQDLERIAQVTQKLIRQLAFWRLFD